MQIVSKLAVAFFAGSLLSTPVVAAEKSFVTVNGATVSQTTFEMFLSQGKSRGMPDTAEMRSQVREELISRELLFQEAKKFGFDKKPEISAKAEAERQKILAQAEATKQAVIIRAFVEDFVKKNPVPDAQLKSEYDAMRAKGGNTEYKARHILVKSEEDAKSIIAKIKQGDKFEELAKLSADPGSKNNGGDLGWSSPEKFVKPFSDALVQLKKGKYSETPVKSDFGYHVIKVEDVRPRKVPTFDEIRPMMKKEAEEQQIKKMIEGLRAKAKIQ